MDENQEGYSQLSDALKKAVEEAQQKKDPDRAPGNPSNPEEVKKGLKEQGILKDPEDPLGFATQEEALQYLETHIPEDKRNLYEPLKPEKKPPEFKVIRHEKTTGEPIFGKALEKKKSERLNLEQLIKIAKSLGLKDEEIRDPNSDWVNPILGRLFSLTEKELIDMDREELQSIIQQTEERVSQTVTEEAKVMGIASEELKGIGLLKLKAMLKERLEETIKEREKQKVQAEAAEVAKPPESPKPEEPAGKSEKREKPEITLTKDQVREQYRLAREIIGRIRRGKPEMADDQMFAGALRRIRENYEWQKSIAATGEFKKLMEEKIAELSGLEAQYQESRELRSKILNGEDFKASWQLVDQVKLLPTDEEKTPLLEAVDKLLGHYHSRVHLTREKKAIKRYAEPLQELLVKKRELLKPYEERILSSPAYKFLERQFLRGISLEELEGKIINRKTRPGFLPKEISSAQLAQAFKMLQNEIKEGRDPLERMAADITIDFLKEEGNYQELNAKDLEESKKNFPEVVKTVWRNFVYGAKADAGVVRPGLRGKDLDVKVSLWLLERAGIQAAGKAKPVHQGTMEAGAFNIDTSGQSGLFRDVDEKLPTYKTFELPISPAVGADDHPHGRVLPSSTAKILLEGLKRCGLLEEQFGEKARDRKAGIERRAIEMMVKLSVDGDNGTFPVSKNGRLADFQKSHKTLLGLSRYMTANQIFDYFQSYGQGGRFKDAYASAVVERELDSDDIESYKLNKRVKDPKTGKENLSPLEKAMATVQDAETKLIKPLQALSPEERERFYRTGKIMDTRFGTYVVDLIRKKSDKLRGGHAAVQAYGYDGYIIYDKRQNFYLINTFKEGVDFSKDRNLLNLPQKTIVRGNILIKSEHGKPLKVKFRDIINAVTAKDYRPQGRIREYLDFEREDEKLEQEADKAYKGDLRESFRQHMLEKAKSKGWDLSREEQEQLELYVEQEVQQMYEETQQKQPWRIERMKRVLKDTSALEVELGV